MYNNKFKYKKTIPKEKICPNQKWAWENKDSNSSLNLQ